MNGVYGTKKPAYITQDDVDIFYFYRPNRNTDSDTFNGKWKKLDDTVLEQCFTDNDGTKTVLPGMFDLHLPLELFGEVGIYNVYIKPKEVAAKILDVSTFYAYPDVRGIVLDLSNTELRANNGDLVGYRVEYFNGNNREDYFRIITSNNKCEPVAQNLNDGYSKGITYRFNDSSDLVFCTLTPSSSMSFKSSSLPYIGSPQQDIVLINTKFDPVMIEIEMVDRDIHSVATMLEGRQLRNLSTGTITTFDENGGIYHQADYGNIINPEVGINHDFKLPKNAIDMGEKAKLTQIEAQV